MVEELDTDILVDMFLFLRKDTCFCIDEDDWIVLDDSIDITIGLEAYYTDSILNSLTK